jgi:ligand-binding sensor domain-containing protein
MTFAYYIRRDGLTKPLWNPKSPSLWCSSDLRVLILGSGWNAGATIVVGDRVLQTIQRARLMDGRATHVLPTNKGLWFIHMGVGFWGTEYGQTLTFYPHGASAGQLIVTRDRQGRSSSLHRALVSDGKGVWLAANGGLLYIPEDDPQNLTYYTPYEVPEWDGLFPDTNGKPTYLGFSALHVDQYGYLWAGKLWGQYNLWVRTPQGQWLRLPYQDGSVRQIIEDRRGYKWVLYQNGFLRVISDNGSPENISGYRSQLYTPGNGPLAGLPNTNLRCIAADRNNALWIGTDKGVAVLYGDPFTGNLSLSLPVIDNRYLLEEESITAIAVDGQNRKWFGTLSSGIYITNPEGTRQIAAILAALNSPLPSNYIYSIHPWDLTGETFIVTSDLGIVSYRDWATEPSESSGYAPHFPQPGPPKLRRPGRHTRPVRGEHRAHISRWMGSWCGISWRLVGRRYGTCKR